MLLATEEIKIKTKEEERTKVENKLIRPETDTLRMCYTLASEIETDFFIRLCKSAVKTGDHYKKQIKLVIR